MVQKIKKPVIIIGCPRSGTTFLYTLLGKSKELHSLYNESRFLFKSFYNKYPDKYHDDELKPEDLNDEDKKLLLNEFYKYSVNSRTLGLALQKVLLKYTLLRPIGLLIVKLNELFKNLSGRRSRLVEKTPRNVFKIEFMNKLFPDALFIFIKRDGRSNISSLIEGWKKRAGGKKPRTPSLDRELNIQGYEGTNWRFALPPGWHDYADKTLEEVCAYQWLASNEHALKGFENIPNDRKLIISYEELTEKTPVLIQTICNFADIEYTKEMQDLAEAKPVINTLDGKKPSKDKWKKNEAVMKKTYPMIKAMMERLGYKLETEENLVY